ncbi:MAG: prolipoprotein diacylglyceryl transferase, partial [Bacteriovoracia bacterium]
PSQLYEGVLEGIVLFIILFYLHKKQRFYGVVSAVFLLGYGVFRFIVEFFREPDVQLGYYFGYFTMGQFLCVAMIIASYFIFRWAKKLNIKNPYNQERAS